MFSQPKLVDYNEGGIVSTYHALVAKANEA